MDKKTASDSQKVDPSLLDTSLETGLSTGEAQKRLEKFGENLLPEEKPLSSLTVLLSQFKSPLVYILLGAGVVTAILGEFVDALVISFAVFINTILGFIQEERAGKALEALKKLVHPHARVLRDGEVVTLGTEELVPGDVVLVRQGDKIPADGRFVSTNRLFVEEAILTGESVPIGKTNEMAGFMGTLVTAGNGKLLITSTGFGTAMGEIALSVVDTKEKTPLAKQLDAFSKQLTIMVSILITIVFATGFLMGRPLAETFSTSVALAVSSIPEGLLVGLTVILAIGMQKILARKGLVRNLVSAETLGGVTTICVDKTGTLTEGKMRVVSMIGDQDVLAIQSVLANDLDDPVVIAAWEWASSLIDSTKEVTQRFPRLDSLPFSSECQYFASLNRWENSENIIFVNGAPEVVMDLCSLDKEDKFKLLERLDELTSQGMRTLGMARKIVPNSKEELEETDIGESFEWVGLLAYTDPVRPDVKESLMKTVKAGIRTIVITGDYAKTALSVLEKLDLKVSEENVLTGTELREMSEEDLARFIFRSRDTLLFARTKPNQKLDIITALKKNDEVVAMMGDGVNDAPAVSKADIGIVVGEASDVAKESADLVLLDSSFSTIVAAIEEGRVIFDNTRKVILYLMCDAFEGIFVVLFSTLMRLPLPITAIQILWINLISDGFPHLALTVDPKNPSIMNHPPRSPKETLVSKWMCKLIGIVSLTGGITASLMYVYILKTTQDVTLARSIAFATIGINSLIYVFSVRTLTRPFWEEGFFDNKWLLLAVFAGMGFQFLPFSFESLRDIFGIAPLGILWVYVFGASALMFLIIEVFKWIFRFHFNHVHHESY